MLRKLIEHNRLPYWLTELRVFERLYYFIYPTAARHGVNCRCNCGNWQNKIQNPTCDCKGIASPGPGPV